MEGYGWAWADSFIDRTAPTDTPAAWASCPARVLASSTAFWRAWPYRSLVSSIENDTPPRVMPSPTASVAASMTGPALAHVVDDGA